MAWFIVGVGFLWKPMQHGWQAIYTERWGCLVLLLALTGLWRIRFRSLAFPLALSYFLVMGALSAYVAWFHGHIDVEVLNLLRYVSSQALLAMGAFILFLALGIRIEKPLRFAGWGMFFLIAVTSGRRWEVPLLHNPSMAATFVVLAIPGNPLTLLAAALAHSWSAFLCWLVLTAWGIRLSFAWYERMEVGAVALMGALYAWHYGLRIPDNGRFALWSQYFSWFWSQSWLKVLFGVGPGTTRIWLPILNFSQIKDGRTDVFFWAHNDWLTLLVEGGIVGTALVLASVVILFRLADDEDRGLCLAFGTAMCLNFPCHWVATALIGFALMRRIAVRSTD